ncbi:putative E3 ubiquitin-protein ligase [Sesbania bispinosa]|nr:putative E3 ubiquitin-protein ligase [Sesbania bispinosa]
MNQINQAFTSQIRKGMEKGCHIGFPLMMRVSGLTTLTSRVVKNELKGMGWPSSSFF